MNAKDDVIGGAFNSLRHLGWLESKGLCTPDGLRLHPKEMRIPPLRSAVQMESDVSLGSSVTLDRSTIRVIERGPLCECVRTFTANRPSPITGEYR
ncbi:hypothetical protein NJ7G_0005 [Natrinema sp. J7-2]|nr:hypothetical protein NJ7G_0005 [Natrinema sp. J7-2]